MLTEMDGVEKRDNVIVVAATNRPDMIDKVGFPLNFDMKQKLHLLFVTLFSGNDSVYFIICKKQTFKTSTLFISCADLLN